MTITSVKAADAVGMKVVDWGVRDDTPGAYSSADNGGAAPGLVTQFRGFGHTPVTVRCGAKSAVEDFDVSVAFTFTRGTMEGVELTYGSGQTTDARYALALCSTPKCAPPP